MGATQNFLEGPIELNGRHQPPRQHRFPRPCCVGKGARLLGHSAEPTRVAVLVLPQAPR